MMWFHFASKNIINLFVNKKQFPLFVYASPEKKSMSATEVKDIGFLSIDIEATGQFFGKDKFIAVGFAWGTVEEHHSWKVAVDLGKSAGKSWPVFWEQQGFEMRCWEQFWSNNTAVLDKLQSGPTIAHAELASVLNNKLAEIEANYKKLILVTDTTAFDLVWVSAVLMMNGYLALNYSRLGVHRWGYEIDSLAEGALHMDGNTNWSEFDRLRKEKIYPLLPELGSSSNSHDPEDDAKHILFQYFRIRAFLKSH